MKLFAKITMAILLAGAASASVKAQNIQIPKAYMFGFVASFNDSTVYFTDIQEVDSVWISKKKKMVVGKGNYSYQLRDYFARERELPNRTCVIFSALTRKEIDKKYSKMKQLYVEKAKGKYDVRYLPKSDFTFETVNMGND